jgi:predicted Fe-S protein YdhL (DUF1289 family)
MDAVGQFCTGCLRTLGEISAWRSMEGPGKLAVWALIARRAQEAKTEKPFGPV